MQCFINVPSGDKYWDMVNIFFQAHSIYYSEQKKCFNKIYEKYITLASANIFSYISVFKLYSTHKVLFHYLSISILINHRSQVYFRILSLKNILQFFFYIQNVVKHFRLLTVKWFFFLLSAKAFCDLLLALVVQHFKSVWIISFKVCFWYLY